jgi:hypothetical protein
MIGQDQGHELHNSAINPEKRIYASENCIPRLNSLRHCLWKEEWNDAFKQRHHSKRNHQRVFQQRAASLFTVTRSRALEVLEEIGIGIHDHHVTAILEACTVSFEAAIKFVKLWILAERLGVDL